MRFDSNSTLPKFQLNPNHTKVYIPVESKDYAVVSAESDMGELPVSFKAEKNGNYTFSVNAEDVTFSYLHLIDNLTGADVDLLQQPEYTFNAKVSDYASRFKVVFVANGPSTGSGTDGSETFAFESNGNWIIANEGSATLLVIDLNGRILSSEQINGCAETRINAAAGVYVMRLVNGENVKTQKVIVK